MCHRISLKFLWLFILSICASVLVVFQVISITKINWNSRFAKFVTFQEPFGYGQVELFRTTVTETINRENGDKDIRKILQWTPLFGNWDFLPVGRGVFERCHEKRCTITNERAAIEESDAVIFHIRTLTIYDIPHFRQANQKWIFFTMEAPPYSLFPGFPFMSNMFNWTMTYRHDSDIVIRYGRVTHQKGKGSAKSVKDLQKIWARKSKMAVWLVSHCQTDGNRELYIRELQTYIDVDIYGLCGTAVCPKGDSCLKTFAKEYKFFLSFENSICNDYVTEKFFNVLKYDIVPVAWGGANYSAIAPTHSFINALEYTPRELANHMKYLASNSSHYLEYLKWKTEGFEIHDMDTPCDLCEKLHSKDYVDKSSHVDISKWWITDSNCKQWT